jgi:hypothetical protein
MPLEKKWDKLDDETKRSVCRQIWDMILEIRTIQPPVELKGLFNVPLMAPDERFIP